MDLDVSPEPSPQEHEAVSTALEQLLADRSPRIAGLYDSSWRRAALLENVDDDLDP